MSVNSNVIFENYEEYLNENSDDFHGVGGISNILRDDAAFNDFSNALLEGQDESVRKTVGGVLNRQREMILEEAANNVGASVFTH